MKKLFLTLLFSAVLFIGFPFYNVNAMPITYDVPFSSAPDALGLLEDILNGAKINIKDMTTVEAVLEHYAETVGAKNFLNRQANILSSKLSKMAIDGELTINPNNDLVIPITISDLAYRMGYDPYWYKSYAPQEVKYDQILDRVNIGTIIADNLTGGQTTVSSIGYYENGFSYKPSFSDVTYTGLKYPFIYNCLTESYWIFFDVVGYQVQGINQNNQYNYCYVPCNNLTPTIVSNYPVFYNIDDAINYSRTGKVLEGDAIINAPDVIQVGDTQEWTYDVFFPKIDGLEGLSINQFLEWLQGQLDAQDVNFIDLGMLIADEVPLLVIDDDDPETTPTTRPIEIEDTRPVIDVIDDDPTAPTPTPPYDDPIPIPPFPIIHYPDINPQVQHTVLAELIDATQKTIPSDLMVLIWATFGLLVVGGLIYILHK